GVWDSGDGTYAGSGTSASATVAASYLNDNPSQTVKARIIDKNHGYTDYTTTILVNNVAPTASVSGPTDGSRNTAANFTFTATDPSTADSAAGFTYTINWGDGSATQTVSPTANNGSGVTVSHTYANVGVYTVSTTASDKDRGPSAAATAKITV